MGAPRYEDKPFIAIWELTQACDLACLHCRASAVPDRDPSELTTEEGFRLLERFADAGVPLVVLTGGDPAKRPDLVELVAHGRRLGLGMGLTPSTTPLVTRELLERLAEAGLSRLAVSLDGATAEVHDAFRGVPGSFLQSLRILEDAKELGMVTQVNSSVHGGLINELSSAADLMAQIGVALWSVFFIVPTGRAQSSMVPSTEATEQALLQLSSIAEAAPFAVKTTAAPHYRRVLQERRRETGGPLAHGVYGKRAVRINDGRGFLFVSHRGDVFPSGFLPLWCGNVRDDDVIEVYRNHPLFMRLRDADALVGKCGACEYRSLCGGSRARAFAMTGDPLESDELCGYVPPGYVDAPRRRRVWLEVLDA